MALIKCPECGKQISNEAKKCPNCGYTIKKSHPILSAIGWVFLGLIVLAVFSCEDDEVQTQTTAQGDVAVVADNNAAPAKPKNKVEVVEDHWCHDSDMYVRYVCGVVENNTNKERTHVQIQINLYDASGAQVGSAWDLISNLEAGSKWRFKAPVLEDSATSYKIKDVDYY